MVSLDCSLAKLPAWGPVLVEAAYDQPWMAACLNLLHVQRRWLGVSARAKRHRLEVESYESCPPASTGRHALLCGQV